MNEQLIVKNFGPIKDATVDFKKVTVFIGPTGGGKSTLAKLATVFRKSSMVNFAESSASADQILADYDLDDYLQAGRSSRVKWKAPDGVIVDFGKRSKTDSKNDIKEIVDMMYKKMFSFSDEVRWSS